MEFVDHSDDAFGELLNSWVCVWNILGMFEARELPNTLLNNFNQKMNNVMLSTNLLV